MRCFVAVLFDDATRAALAALCRELSRAAPAVRWVAPEALHLTLKFLGDVTNETVEGVGEVLRRVTSPVGAFDVQLDGAGAFPSVARPRVVWAGVRDGGAELARLAEAVDAGVAPLGFAREERAFKAHATLARIKDRLPRGQDAALAAALEKPHPLPRVRVREVHLMRSVTSPKGPTYTSLAAFALALFLCMFTASAARAAGARGGLTEDLRYQMAVKAAQERRFEKARSLFTALRKAYPQDERATVMLAKVELELGHADKAQALSMELLNRDPTDRFAKEILERLRKSARQPEAPLTFGDEQSGSTWERGDELHAAVPLTTHNATLTVGEPRIVEGPAPPMPEIAPPVRYHLRLEAPAGSREVGFDPAPGPNALVERMGKDGKLAGHMISLPPGQEMPKDAWVPLLLGATRLVVTDPSGKPVAERPLTTDELVKGLLAIARPGKLPGLGAPIGPKPEGPDRILPLARLSARLAPEFAPGGQPAGMWLRVRLVAELAVYPALRALPDAEVPRACPYLLWPLEPPDGAPPLDGLVQKLAAYLDKPGPNSRLNAAAAFRPYAELLDRALGPALEAYRTAQAAKPPRDTGPVAARELRALLTLALVSGRITKLTQEPEAGGLAARQRAAEALLLLSRFHIARK